MGDLLGAFAVVIIGVAIFLAVLLGLYAVSHWLPQGFAERWRVMVFVGPALLLLLIGLVVPAIRTTYLSLFNDAAQPEFVGLDNYKEIFTNPANRRPLINTGLWVVFGTALSTIVGLLVARLADRMRGEALAKALIFLPTAISFVGAGIVWKFVYAGPPVNVGLLNAISRWLGGEGNRLWLIDNPLNTFLLIFVMVWIQAGFATVVFSAAIKGVPDDLLEAGRIDGATERQVFWKVVVPAIRATIVMVITTSVIFALKAFDIVRAMTGGNFETDVIANRYYSASFTQRLPNFASSLAVLLFILVIPVVVINQRSQRRQQEMG